MRPAFVVAVLALSLAVDLSGCAAHGRHVIPPASTEPPPLVPTNADYGAVEGFVFNPEYLPMANATVEVVGTNRTALTDATGYYLFLPLDPGETSLRVNISRYLPVVRKVLVPTADSLRIDFNLREIPTPDPYIDKTYTRRGHLDCQARANASAGGQGTNTNPSCTDSAAQQYTEPYLPPNQGANVTMLPGVGGVVIELQWTSSLQGGPNDVLRVAIRTSEASTWRQYEGTSVLKIVLSPADMADLAKFAERNYENEGGRLLFNLYPGEKVNNGAVGGAGATVQQDYTLYVTIFYRQPADPKYSRLASS